MDPQTGSDDYCEWIEVYNPTAAPVDMSGWLVQTGAAAHVLDPTTPRVIAPGGRLVLARNGDVVRVPEGHHPVGAAPGSNV